MSLPAGRQVLSPEKKIRILTTRYSLLNTKKVLRNRDFFVLSFSYKRIYSFKKIS